MNYEKLHYKGEPYRLRGQRDSSVPHKHIYVDTVTLI